MSMKSYTGKVFIVEDNETLLRRADDLSQFELYKPGDIIPPGKNPGDPKLIPKRTQVTVTDTRINDAGTVFAFIKPAVTNAVIPAGWTKAANLADGMINETLGLAPSDWTLPPQGNNYTVIDPQAKLRGGSPGFAATGKIVPVGTLVIVTRRAQVVAPPATYFRISRGTVADGQIKTLEDLGWTVSNNLIEGWANFFSAPAWADEQGLNACWDDGRFIGAKILVNLVGVGSQMEQVTLESLAPWTRLKEAMAKKNLVLAIESGFRTFQKQAKLFDAFQRGIGNLAAKPGFSNHQHGQAFDLNTKGFDGNPIYDWLKKNGPRFGFIRTVNHEHWHWEYRPDEAAKLAAQGKFALPSVQN